MVGLAVRIGRGQSVFTMAPAQRSIFDSTRSRKTSVAFLAAGRPRVLSTSETRRISCFLVGCARQRSDPAQGCLPGRLTGGGGYRNISAMLVPKVTGPGRAYAAAVTPCAPDQLRMGQSPILEDAAKNSSLRWSRSARSRR